MKTIWKGAHVCAVLLLVAVLSGMAQAQVFNGARVTVTKTQPWKSAWTNTLGDTLICVGGANDTSATVQTIKVSEAPGTCFLLKTRADSIPNKDTPDNLFIEYRARWDEDQPWSLLSWARYDTIAGNAWAAWGATTMYNYQARYLHALGSSTASTALMSQPPPYEVQLRAIATDADACSVKVAFQIQIK